MKVGFACGVFDLFHAGHVRMLKECKQHCDHLLLALNKAGELPSQKNPPIYSFQERWEIMEACKYVDELAAYDGEAELLQLMKERRIDVRFLGEDYKGRENEITGAELDIPLHFTDRSHGLSTSGVRAAILEKGR
jgi:glycerol-3-phosphate cytidylyltransferase